MANTKKQFMVMYDEAVDLLKRYKQSNDNLNKSIGVQHQSSITLKIRADQHNHMSMIKKLDSVLQKLQQSYLDPDTARKIGTVKQQYKIQKDRRAHIMRELSEAGHAHQTIPRENAEIQNYINYTVANTKSHQPVFKRENNKEQRFSSSTMHTINKHNEEQITEYDYEIQCKLLQEKNKALQQTEKQIINVYNITKECNEMVQFQGEHIDIISDQIFHTNQNTTAALKDIKEANEQSKKRRKKIFFLSFLTVIATLILLLFLFF